MTVPRVILATLQQSMAIVDSQGRPTPAFLRFVNGAILSLKNGVNSIIDAQNAADAATAAAAAANAAAASATSAATGAQNAADATTAEQSLVNSYVENFAGASPLSADTAGNVTILSHDRHYGDSTLNPTRAVTSGLVATGAAATSVVRIFYDDPTRAGGAVTYQFTTDPADPPVQGGDRHVVGAVEIPAAGTSDGGYVRPPGYTGPIP